MNSEYLELLQELKRCFCISEEKIRSDYATVP